MIVIFLLTNLKFLEIFLNCFLKFEKKLWYKLERDAMTNSTYNNQNINENYYTLETINPSTFDPVINRKIYFVSSLNIWMF